MIPWRQAWQEALYGPRGFYRGPSGPAGHFTTSVHAGPGALFAEAIGALADEHRVCRVLDLASGRGELLAHLARLRPDLTLTGCDVVERPADLPPEIGWVRSPGGPDLTDDLGTLDGTLVVANEWLDVVPCPIAQVADDGTLREVLVDPATGDERLGDPLTGPDLAWATEHWPADEPGQRVEIGRARDDAWAALLDRVGTGVALAVDYGHVAGGRPWDGTLTAYREGVQLDPTPDGTCDLTAHVAMDTLRHTRLATQRDELARLVSAPRPTHDDAVRDPLGYLRALERHSYLAALRAPGGLGGFLWATWDGAAAGVD